MGTGRMGVRLALLLAESGGRVTLERVLNFKRVLLRRSLTSV
jgi:hypothetical protein